MKNGLSTRTINSITYAIALVTIVCGQAHGQSTQKTHTGSSARQMPPAMPRSSAGSGDKSATAISPALGGYYPVCIVTGKGWVKGTPQFQTTYDGKNYHFPNTKAKQMFDAHPVKYEVADPRPSNH